MLAGSNLFPNQLTTLRQYSRSVRAVKLYKTVCCGNILLAHKHYKSICTRCIVWLWKLNEWQRKLHLPGHGSQHDQVGLLFVVSNHSVLHITVETKIHVKEKLSGHHYQQGLQISTKETGSKARHYISSRMLSVAPQQADGSFYPVSGHRRKTTSCSAQL